MTDAPGQFRLKWPSDRPGMVPRARTIDDDLPPSLQTDLIVLAWLNRVSISFGKISLDVGILMIAWIKKELLFA